MEFISVREVVLQYRGEASMSDGSLRSPESVGDFVRSILPDNVREHFVTLYFNQGLRVIAYAVTATGTAVSCPVHPREVFQIAVMLGACHVMVAHNHPSGDLTPSKDDIEVTRRLKEAGDVLGIRLVDHVIVSGEGTFSFHSSDML